MKLWKRMLTTCLALGIMLSLLPCSALVADGDAVPTPDEVYNVLIAQKDIEGFTEGTIWNDRTHTYRNFKGGLINGKNIIATGCVAFAFQLSDLAFGNLPARQYTSVSLDQVKAGDILRTNNDTHTVIVLQVSDNGLVLAEGNYSGKVHWGRTMTEAEFKRNVSHYITRYPEGYIPPTDESANEIIANGQFGTGMSWSLTNAGTLTISGTGAMPDFSSYSEQPWYSHNDKIMKIVVEDGITTIGQAAFWMSKALTVRIPDSVTKIKNHAFRESSLISVTIPGSVKTIGDDAFRACANLALAAMMEGVSTIGQRAFQGCTKLVSVDLPVSIADLGAGAFYNCTELNFVMFASGNKNTVKIGDNMFMGCWNLFPLTLPEHIDKISKEMFYNCYYMFTGLEIPQGVTTIGESAFSSCFAMSVLIIPDSVTDIERSAFLNTGLTDIYFKGTEAQWKKIWKSPDLTPILQKVTMHYGELPEDPDPNHRHEHEWGKSEVIQEATETEDGLKIYYCTICDETLREVIPAPIATPLPEVTQEPTASPAETVTPLPNVTSEPAPDVTIPPISTPTVNPTSTPEILFTLEIIGVDNQNRVINGIKVEGDTNTDNAIGIVALYNSDGILKQFETTKSNTVIHGGTYELNHSIKYDNDKDICKVFVWKGFDALKPLAAAYEYSIEKQYIR